MSEPVNPTPATNGTPGTVPPEPAHGARNSADDGATTGPAVPGLPPARVGRYPVFGELGRGGMGAVLLSSDPELGRDLALKVMLGDGVARPDVVQRFREEAQVGGQLQHPGVVPVYELGRAGGGRHRHPHGAQRRGAGDE